MGDHLRQAVRLHSTQSKNRANNGIFVASWNIGARDINVGKEQIWIWSIWADLGLLALYERVCNPAGNND